MDTSISCFTLFINTLILISSSSPLLYIIYIIMRFVTLITPLHIHVDTSSTHKISVDWPIWMFNHIYSRSTRLNNIFFSFFQWKSYMNWIRQYCRSINLYATCVFYQVFVYIYSLDVSCKFKGNLNSLWFLSVNLTILWTVKFGWFCYTLSVIVICL